jgi:hypothetical protein
MNNRKNAAAIDIGVALHGMRPEAGDESGSHETQRWRKADSNCSSHLRLDGSDAGEPDRQIAMSPLRRSIARTVGDCAYPSPRVSLRRCAARGGRINVPPSSS